MPKRIGAISLIIKLVKRPLILALVLSSSLGCNELNSAPENSAKLRSNLAQSRLEEFESSLTPLRWMVAHRGARGVYPDNTVNSLVAAADMGAPMVEFDIRASKNGDLFLYHDAIIHERVFEGNSELVGLRFSELLSTQITKLRYADSSRSHIPTLKEALQALKDKSVLILPELKSATPATFASMISIIRESGFQSRTVLQCSSEFTIRELCRKDKTIKILARLTRPEQLPLVLPLAPAIIQIDESWMTPPIVEQIHSHGARILIKTLDGLDDSELHWRRLFDAAIDLILTDRFYYMGT